MDKSEYLQSCFAEQQITLDDMQTTKLLQYLDHLFTENHRQNLTRIVDFEDAVHRHLLDSAILLQYLPNQAHSILDLGTGAGIPGIPLSILRPDIHFTLLDSELSKISFCQSMIETLSLNAQAIASRAEDLAHGTMRNSFDCAVSRAMANGSMLTELAVPFLRIGGTLLAMKGSNYNPENERFAQASAAMSCACPIVHVYQLDGLQKFIIEIRKQADTPEKYPRRFAKIKRAPL